MEIENIRREYTKGGLTKKDIPNNPFELFDKWLTNAIEGKVNEPTAVLVTTVSGEGKPSSRTVLLKEVSQGGFVFYTNYNSRKGQQIAGNPNVSMSFVWHELERQIHIEGVAEKISSEESDSYFAKRPYTSRVGARISPQSHEIDSRFQLMRAFVAESAKWIGREVQRPDNWGGYRVKPTRIEFWQGRPSRLHDRFVYTLNEGNTWTVKRVAP